MGRYVKMKYLSTDKVPSNPGTGTKYRYQPQRDRESFKAHPTRLKLYDKPTNLSSPVSLLPPPPPSTSFSYNITTIRTLFPNPHLGRFSTSLRRPCLSSPWRLSNLSRIRRRRWMSMVEVSARQCSLVRSRVGLLRWLIS